MKLLPFEKVTFQSPLTEAQIEQRLLNVTQPKIKPKPFAVKTYSDNGKTYEGNVSASGFSIQRIIRGRNSFLPQLNGTFQKNLDKTDIAVKMHMDKRVNLFLIVWLIGVGIGGTWELTMMSTEKTGMPNYIPLLMVVFMYIMMMVSFKAESKKSIKQMEELFEAKVTNA